MKTFLDLDAWEVGLELVEAVYVLTKDFPSDERFGITSQLRRASTSILANIAEGFGRYTYADKAAKYVIARGECTEVEAFLYIILRLRFVDAVKIQKPLQCALRMEKLLSGLIRSSRQMSAQ
jgi:four helix bundle protein